MATKANLTRMAKAYERRVQRYLDPQGHVDWEPGEDLRITDVNLWQWIGEVKCRRTLTFGEGCRLVREAMEQLLVPAPSDYDNPLIPLRFVVIHTKGCPLEKDWVFESEGRSGISGPYTLAEFRQRWLPT